jgi:membrane protease subunit HflC
VLRAVLGDVSSNDIISGQRAQLMARLAENLNKEADDFGITVIDVRIRRAELPQANSERVFERMRTERQQQAAQFRAEGTEAAERIRAEADRQRTVTLAEARETSEKIRGDGDAKRNEIYAQAFGKDPEFAAFYRSMIAYERAIGEGTPMVMSSDSEFFRYFKDGTDGR